MSYDIRIASQIDIDIVIHHEFIDFFGFLSLCLGIAQSAKFMNHSQCSISIFFFL